MINSFNWKDLGTQFEKNHFAVIDNFFDDTFIDRIADSFPDYNSDVWNAEYNSPLENKKACNIWDRFPDDLYRTMYFLNTDEFLENIYEMMGTKEIFSDFGLHGGGLHAHSTGGFLNMHKDYETHPKLMLTRKLNLIVYLTKDWDRNWNGGLEFRVNNNQDCVGKIECKFNRAVLFDTTVDMWHGLPDKITCPANISRNSLAIYYYIAPDMSKLGQGRMRALFSPAPHQVGDAEIEKLIKLRSERK